MNTENDMATSPPPPPAPPRNPLHILQCFLSSLPPVDDQDSSSNQQERIDQVLRVADFLFSNCMDGALSILDNEPSLITKLVSAESQRSLYLVQGSSHKGKMENEIYLCYISSDCMDGRSMHHCSCRSFWERSRSCTGSATLCKHLLALHLMPALGINCCIMEVAKDVDFANIVVSRLRINY